LQIKKLPSVTQSTFGKVQRERKVHQFELVQNRIIIVGVGKNNLVIELWLDEVFVRSWHCACLVQVGREAVFA